MSDNWFNQGYDNVDKAERERSTGGKGASRWWMPAGTEDRPSEKECIFLDDEPFCFYEHNPKIGGEFKGHWYTCTQGVWPGERCAMCANDVPRYYVGLLSALDLSEWEYQGRIYKNMRRIFPAKIDTLKLLRTKKKRRGSLVGTRWLISRTAAKAPNVGNDFEFIGEEKLERDEQSGLLLLSDRQYWWEDREGVVHPPTPFDYKKQCAPLPNKELAAILSGSVVEDSNSQSNRGASSNNGNAGDKPSYNSNASSGSGSGSGPMSPDEEEVPY